MQAAIDALTARLDALEVKAAFQEQTIEDLNATITAQWREIERLARLLQRLEDEMRESAAAAGTANLPEPPPPHY